MDCDKCDNIGNIQFWRNNWKYFLNTKKLKKFDEIYTTIRLITCGDFIRRLKWSKIFISFIFQIVSFKDQIKRKTIKDFKKFRSMFLVINPHCKQNRNHLLLYNKPTWIKAMIKTENGKYNRKMKKHYIRRTEKRNWEGDTCNRMLKHVFLSLSDF